MRRVSRSFRRRWTGSFVASSGRLWGVTLTIYYVTPWIRWDRGAHLPDQAVLVNLGNRRFFFWIEI